MCPLSKKCITESVAYQATVTINIKDKTTNRPPKTYVGLTENSFKQDLQTIKHHSTLLRNGTLLNLANTCGN